MTVERINKYGGVKIHAPRLLFVNGVDDPWLHVTAHSPLAGDMRTKFGDGYLLHQGGFANDRTALSRLADEPIEIQMIHEKEIETVKGWVTEFEKEHKGVSDEL